MMSDYRTRSCVQAHQPRGLAWMSSKDFGHRVSRVSLKPRPRERWALERCPSLLRRPAPRHWLTNVPRGTRCPCSRLRPWSYGRAGLTAVAQSQTPIQLRTDAQHRTLTTVSNPHSVSDWTQSPRQLSAQQQTSSPDDELSRTIILTAPDGRQPYVRSVTPRPQAPEKDCVCHPLRHPRSRIRFSP